MSFNSAINFALNDKSTLYTEVQENILSLIKEIEKIYKKHLHRNTGEHCDICGKGVFTKEIMPRNQNSNVTFTYLPRDVIIGYEHRPSDSPILCFSHSCGWNKVFKDKQRQHIFDNCIDDDQWKLCKFDYEEEMIQKYGLPDEKIDLNFAMYLAKRLLQLSKEKRKENV
jgi:hypothetical protein